MKQAKADAKQPPTDTQPDVDSVGNEAANIPQITPTGQPSAAVVLMKVVEAPVSVETPVPVDPEEQKLKLTPAEQATSDFFGKTLPAAKAAANAALAASDLHSLLRSVTSQFAVSCDALVYQVEPMLKSVDQFTDDDWNSIRRVRINLRNVDKMLAKFEGKKPADKPATK